MGAKTLKKMTGRAWVGVLACALAGCGGGGGGGDASPDSGSTAAAPLALRTAQIAQVSANAVGASEAVLQFGQLAADYGSRYLATGAPLSTSETCPNGGVATVTLRDADSDLKASAGDTITVTWQDCAVPLIGEVFDGTFTIDIVSASAGADASLNATLNLARGLTLKGTGPDVTIRFVGSLAIAWSRTDVRTTLNVASTAADDLRLEARGPSRSGTEAFKAMAMKKDLRFDEARSVVTLALQLESDVLGGAITVSTPQPLMAYLNRYPETGRVEVRGAGPGVIAVKPNFVNDNQAYVAELDSNGSGVFASPTFVSWSAASFGYLWWDGVGALQWGSNPYATQNFLSTDFTVTGRFVDVPGPDDSFQLQFSRPLANTPALQFRFRDSGSTIGFDPNIQNVAATAVQRGARVTIRPERPLDHARNYYLEVSVDGQNWNVSATFQDALANALTVYSYQFYFQTPDTLRAVVTATAGLLDSAQASSQLDASASVSTQRPIASYAWRQLNGTPLRIVSPQSPVTAVQWGSTPPTGVENVTFELTVTDTAGDVETGRVTITAFNSASAARVLYFRSAPGDYIGGGQTSIVSDTNGTFTADAVNNGYVTYSYFALPPEFGSWWNLTLATADGAPFSVGAYENAIRAPFHGTQNGVDFSGSGRGCNMIVGRFDVLEISTDPQGTITRLAVDFEQHCETAQAPALLGSLRINSTLPIRR